VKTETRVGLGPNSTLGPREKIQLLINIVSPDPRYQPWYLYDSATIFDVRELNETTVRPRLEGYFGKTFDLDLSTALGELVDQIKDRYPGWPDDWE
jgi:hypothetical protein